MQCSRNYFSPDFRAFMFASFLLFGVMFYFCHYKWGWDDHFCRELLQDDFQEMREVTQSILVSSFKASDADYPSAFWKVVPVPPEADRAFACWFLQSLLIQWCIMRRLTEAYHFSESENRLEGLWPETRNLVSALRFISCDIGWVLLPLSGSQFSQVKWGWVHRWSCKLFQLKFSLTFWENITCLSAIGGSELKVWCFHIYIYKAASKIAL